MVTISAEAKQPRKGCGSLRHCRRASVPEMHSGRWLLSMDGHSLGSQKQLPVTLLYSKIWFARQVYMTISFRVMLNKVVACKILVGG